ncbi:Centrosomal protein of 19 kDa [Thoreauomyces humboldtii]|nr:Centrosomal protein of 19 kDa [Thoreauomyces humboldtii]
MPSFLTKDTLTHKEPAAGAPPPFSLDVPSTASRRTGRLRIIPRRLAVRYKSPTLVLFYLNDGKTRRRSMPIRGLGKEGKEDLAKGLKEKHEAYLGTVKLEQLRRLVELVRAHTSSTTPAAVHPSAEKRAVAPLPSSLPTVVPRDTAASMLGALPPLKPSAAAVAPLIHVTEAPTVKKETAFTVDGKKDLNKLGDAELEAVKREMNTEFERNRVRKDDPDFVYDVQKSYGPPVDGDNDWDEESEVLASAASSNKPSASAPLTNTILAKPATKTDVDSYDISENIEDLLEDESFEDEESERLPFAATSRTAARTSFDDEENGNDDGDEDDEDVGIEAEIERMERESGRKEPKSMPSLTPTLGTTVPASSTALPRDPPSALHNAPIPHPDPATTPHTTSVPHPTPSLAPLSTPSTSLTNAPVKLPITSGLTSLAPLTSLKPLVPPPPTPATPALAPLRTGPQPTTHVVAPLVSATTPRPVSAMTISPPAVANDEIEDVSEDIMVFDSDVGGEEEDEDEADDRARSGTKPTARPVMSPPQVASGPVPVAATSLSGLPGLPGMTHAKPSVEKQEAVQEDQDEGSVSSGFGAGHTDDEADGDNDDDGGILVEDPSDDEDEDGEIVFSDDNLSYGDDAF